MNATLTKTIEQLEVLFNECNARFFDNQVVRPVIAVNSDESASAFGWMTTWKAWQDGKTDGYYEINICAEYLNRKLPDLLGTMLHEMTHLLNLQNGVKDTSRGNTYHNKNFKVEAEKRGLIIDRHEKYGWTITKLNEEGIEFAEQFKDFQFDLHRTGAVQAETSAKKKSSTRKYVCPECGTIIRATKEVNILCGECSSEDNLVRMELESGDEN